MLHKRFFCLAHSYKIDQAYKGSSVQLSISHY